jgi:hypothetical protein
VLSRYSPRLHVVTARLTEPAQIPLRVKRGFGHPVTILL